MLWDEGRRTGFQLFMLFSEYGGRRTVNIFLLFSLFQALFTRGAELASRSDTGLRKQTGEGEAFTGGGVYLPPKMESLFYSGPGYPASATGHRCYLDLRADSLFQGGYV